MIIIDIWELNLKIFQNSIMINAKHNLAENYKCCLYIGYVLPFKCAKVFLK